MATDENSLGLNFDNPPEASSTAVAANDKKPDVAVPPTASDATATDSQEEKQQDGDAKEREKKKPYVNPERVKTGGAQRASHSACSIV